MKFVVLTILFASSIWASHSGETHDAEPEITVNQSTFMTSIDHLNPTNRTQFFYSANAQHFQAGGPVYIYIKDINDVSTKSIESGPVVDVARTTAALLLTFDMRFFGKNRPTSDASMESLTLLTVDQALADIAMFIRFVRETLTKSDSSVILCGSGYGGTLAAWATQRYPHLVAGSWSSSGLFDMPAFTYAPIEHLRILLEENDKASSDFMCRDNLQQVYRTLNELIENGHGQLVSEKFQLCHPIDTDSEEDVSAFYELIITTIFDYIKHYDSYGVKTFCSLLENQNPDNPLAAFTKWFKATQIELPSPLPAVVLIDSHTYCFDHSFYGIVRRSSNTEWDTHSTDSGRRQWSYLQCTQLGGFLIANKLTWIPQSITRDYHMKKCNKMFGTPIDSKPLETTMKALKEEFDEWSSNIHYTSGEMDPWKIFSREFDSRRYAVRIDNFVQSADLTSISAADSPSLYHAKKTASNLMAHNEYLSADEKLLLDLTFMSHWWEDEGEGEEWEDEYWLKVFELMKQMEEKNARTKETINDDDDDYETEAEIKDEGGSAEETDDDEDIVGVYIDQVIQSKVQKPLEFLENQEDQARNSDQGDSIVGEAILMVKLALKFIEVNRHLCDLSDYDEESNESMTDESDDISKWYSTKIFENWAQPMDFSKFDDKFLKNCKLAVEWLENDFFKFDFEDEFKHVDTPEFRKIYIVSKLSLQYGKYDDERGNIFRKSEKM